MLLGICESKISGQGRSLLSKGRKWGKNIFWCTAKPYEIPKVKNALVTYVLRHGMHHLHTYPAVQQSINIVR
jgi:hypothetical protein